MNPLDIFDATDDELQSWLKMGPSECDRELIMQELAERNTGGDEFL